VQADDLLAPLMQLLQRLKTSVFFVHALLTPAKHGNFNLLRAGSIAASRQID
jgi:hypothetical protein